MLLSRTLQMNASMPKNVLIQPEVISKKDRESAFQKRGPNKGKLKKGFRYVKLNNLTTVIVKTPIKKKNPSKTFLTK